MLVPSHNHQGIHLRNFLALFVCLSFVGFIHLELKQTTSNIEHTNSIINSILRNQTHSISRSDLFKLQDSLMLKKYAQLSQSQCLLKIDFDVSKNQQFLDQPHQKYQEQSKGVFSYFGKKELAFNQLKFPTTMHDFKNFESCSDIITMMNYLNPLKMDLIYTSFMQQKYGSFKAQQSDKQRSYSAINNSKFCVMVNQFNTSLTKLRINLNSLIDQSYENYKVVVLDNGSGDGSYEIAKIVLEDLKDKLIKENPTQIKTIHDKYQAIKEQHNLPEWDLYTKHEELCKGSDYVIFVDGRDEFVSRHALNIMNNAILLKKSKPSLITASILQKTELNRQLPYSTQKDSRKRAHQTFTFKAISSSLFKSSKQLVASQIRSLIHPHLIHTKITQVLVEEASSKEDGVLQIGEMLYLYDNLENKQHDRNVYFVEIARKQAQKQSKLAKK